MRLLVTRPADDAERTARALEKLGHEPVISPALQVRFNIDVRLPTGPLQAVVVTSSNAVSALLRHRQLESIRGATVLAVGDRTAVEARRAGFAAAFSAGGNAADLIGLVREHCAPEAGPLIYAAGAHQASDLSGGLTEAGFDVQTVIVYRTEPTKGIALAAEAGLRDGTIDGVLFYSARSAGMFGKQLETADLFPLSDVVTCYCLSEAIAEIVHGFASGPVRVSTAPNQLALFALLESPPGPNETKSIN